MISSQTFPKSIQLQVDALIASVMEHKDCSKPVAVGSVINMLVEMLTHNQTLAFGMNTQYKADEPQQTPQNFWPIQPSEPIRSESAALSIPSLHFRYKPLQVLYDQYRALLKHLKPESTAATSDAGDILALKLFSFDAGIHDRYMSEDKYQFPKVLKRVMDAFKFQGNLGPHEQKCLSALKQQIGATFHHNSKVYYSDGYCATPDAVELNQGEITAIAEFKATRVEEGLLKGKVINPARLQLQFGMKAAQVRKGYLVLYLLCLGDEVPTDERTRIVTVTLGSEDAEKIREREIMQRRFLGDLCEKTEAALPEEFTKLVKLRSGGFNGGSGDESDTWGVFASEKDESPNTNALAKRKAPKL